MYKTLAFLIFLVTVGCGQSQEVVMPENPSALPPEDVMQVGGGDGSTTTTDAASPPPLPTPGQ